MHMYLNLKHPCAQVRSVLGRPELQGVPTSPYTVLDAINRGGTGNEVYHDRYRPKHIYL